ncbi:hypothetical protein N7475_006345 [Penicillium sp. IBT 31633x]|nr:hypothetical protein N7475_006345 [Penicillium sp. IBT 31633x]
MKFWERLPTYEESTRSAMGKRTKQLQSAQLPADLLEPLLSKDLSMNEKHDLIEEAPDAVFDKTDGTYGTATLNLENQLVNAKYDELAQRVACRFHLRNASANLDWCKELVELDINRRWVIQRKEWLEGKITTIETSVKNPVSHSELLGYTEEAMVQFRQHKERLGQSSIEETKKTPRLVFVGCAS